MKNNVTRIILLFILLLAFSRPAFAIEISGSVHNSDGYPVRFALVSIYGNSDFADCICSSWTDTNGNFSITVDSLSEESLIHILAKKDNEFGMSEGRAGEVFNIIIDQENRVFVPEFPVIAIPLAAMIALVFLIITGKKNN